ncbi:MAG: hypothetical protein AseanaTS_08280 [Candidatus Pelagadaptatus aseana]
MQVLQEQKLVLRIPAPAAYMPSLESPLLRIHAPAAYMPSLAIKKPTRGLAKNVTKVRKRE